MADNWEDVAEYLLRNRRLREMVHDVLNSLDEISPECRFTTDENRKHEKRNKNNKGITKPDLIQKQRLLKEYQMTKYLTQESKKELARELNLSQVTVKNWFQNRRRREALLKRNKTVNKMRRMSIRKNDDGVPCLVPRNVDIKISEVLKSETRQLNYQNNLPGFVVTQDENGICLLHEL
ncbi:homeobox GBX-2-like [Paramuricea clavata]|uniref:Homeobox GBX-2-like n=1 Tax=Paramuricea clavata TaxID=317549 RepID=A0A6S7LGW4_PARCT|nr:homeobox GBX-2-like [Paramuricea clavata]